jgi:ornithine carbamoyltransferase
MRHLLRLNDWTTADLQALFERADRYRAGSGPVFSGCVALFFPLSSLRTRLSFERGAGQMGLQPVTFPPEALDTGEDLFDVAGYLAEWADIVVARHPDIQVLERLAAAGALPVINAMTDINHPCEILSDLYTLSLDTDPLDLRYVFIGPDGNISRAWLEAAQAFTLEIVQCCPMDLGTPGMPWNDDLLAVVSGADVILTDGPGRHEAAMAPYRVTSEILKRAPEGVRLAPCPPFVRGREVSADAIDHRAFVGYDFKSSLLPVQQALMSLVLEDTAPVPPAS